MTEHEEKIKELIKCGELEKWLCTQPISSFPTYYPAKGEKSYPERYQDLKTALVPLHNIVEKGAMVAAANKWRREICQEIETLKQAKTGENDVDRLNSALDADPIVYLNQHGTGHVDKVIEKAYDLLVNFTSGMLSSFEVFLLLCSIQVHDTGNVIGRNEHEKSIRKVTQGEVSRSIPDAPTQKYIYRIAQLHSGSVNADRDTIGAAIASSALLLESKLCDRSIRAPLLAAILGFADELADDRSRADERALDLGIVSDASAIYHQYSRSLHTVSIEKNPVNQTLYLLLVYFIDSDLVTMRFPKYDSTQLLIDEIFLRTRKVEQERRYCMRFFSQHLPIVEIRVKIEIDHRYDLMKPWIITYTLKENGYPSSDIIIDCLENTGAKVIATLNENGWGLQE